MEIPEAEKAKIINQFLLDKLTYVVAHEEMLLGEEIGDWADNQGVGHFVFIPMNTINELRELGAT